MRFVLSQRQWGLGLLLLIGLAGSGCGSSTSNPTPEAATTGADVVATVAPVGDRYSSQAQTPPTPALEHVKLPEVRNAPVPFVVLHTSQGDIKIRLDADRAPRTVYNFISYVNAGYYNGTIFHQVEKGYALLGGGYTEDLQERPARYPIPSEANNGLKNARGTIAMARQLDNPDSATSQFIINLNDNPSFDHRGPEPENFGFCVFGEVVEGWETLDRIAAVAVQDRESFTRLPIEAVKILSVQTMR